MKCFTVTESRVYDGLAVAASPYRHVGVGERGRGRSYGMVAVGSKDFPSEEVLQAASVIKTAARGTIILVKEKEGDTTRALVALKVAAGYRGSTHFPSLEPRKTKVCPGRVGQARWGLKLWSKCPECGETLSEGTHPDAGVVTDYSAMTWPPRGVTALAQGYKAQGDAGRMGGHDEHILIMEPGSMIKVERKGRLYGGPPEVWVGWTGSEMILSSNSAHFAEKMEGPEEAQGELI